MKRLRHNSSDEDDNTGRGPASFSNRGPVHNQAVTQNNSGPTYHAPVYNTYVTGKLGTSQQEQRELLLQEKRQRCLEILKFSRMDSRRDTIHGAHSQTCEWILDQAEFQDWSCGKRFDDYHGFLWIKGKPGTGKSTITKHIFDHMKRIPTSNVISFFFNARGDALEKSASGMYRSLIVQLLAMMPDLQVILDDHFDALLYTDHMSIDLSGNEVLKHLLHRAIMRLGQRDLVCFIDALDECNEAQARDMVEFFSMLGELTTSSTFRFRTFLSSRHYPHITIAKGLELILEHQPGHSKDLTLYAASKLRIGCSKLAERIRNEIVERSCGIFLWIVLVIEILNKEYDRGHIHALKKRLDSIPNDLENLFHDIIMRDGSANPEVIVCLQWVLFARRPLRPVELYLGILSGTEPDEIETWNNTEITQDDVRRFILDASKGLVEETRGAAPTIQFIHESVREFLLKGSGLQAHHFGPPETFEARGHDQLKQCCYIYYEKAKVRERLRLPETLPEAYSREGQELRLRCPRLFPLLEYSVQNVFYHSDAAHNLEICQKSFVGEVNLSVWVHRHNLVEYHPSKHYSPNVTFGYVLADLGLAHLIAMDPEGTNDVCVRDERYGYPLFAAIAGGHEMTIRALLSPLHFNTAARGRLTIDISENDVQTAASTLLNMKSDIGKDRHPLPWAAERNEILIVKCLLAYSELNANTKLVNQGAGGMALRFAAEGGHSKVVKLLLANGVCNINSKSPLGNTALHLAVQHGHSEIVEMILAYNDCDVDSTNYNGDTALHVAARCGRSDFLESVFTKDNDDANFNYWTMRVHEVPVLFHGDHLTKMLLARDGCSINWVNISGFTALDIALTHGHGGVAKELLAHPSCEVELNQLNRIGRTPFWLAVVWRQDNLAELLMTRPGFDINKEDHNRMTPLMLAAQHGCLGLVSELLSRRDIEIDARNLHGRTSLSYAIWNKQLEIVKLLLDKQEIEVNAHDANGKAPLHIAVHRGERRIIQLLLAYDTIEVNIIDNYGRTPLHWAMNAQHVGIVRQLLATKSIDVNAQDFRRWSPLHYAVSKGNLETTKLMLAHKEIDITVQNFDGYDPINLARLNQHSAVVAVLEAAMIIQYDL